MSSKHKRASKAGPRHLRLYHWLMQTPAWHDLTAIDRAIYIEISSRYAGAGTNNGRIPYSVREAATELKISPATASRALARLQDHGFIAPTQKGAFSLKQRHATEWRLTEFPCDVTKAALASKEFMRWQPQACVAPSSSPRCGGALRGRAAMLAAQAKGANIIQAFPPGKHSGVAPQAPSKTKLPRDGCTTGTVT